MCCRSRAWKTNLLQVFQAVLFVFVIWAINKAITYSRERTPAFSEVHSPPAIAVTSIPDCSQNKFLQVANGLVSTVLHTLVAAVCLWALPLTLMQWLLRCAVVQVLLSCAFCTTGDCTESMCAFWLQQGAECLTFLYTPNNDTTVNAIVAAMRSNNVPPIPQSKTMGLQSMSEVTPNPVVLKQRVGLHKLYYTLVLLPLLCPFHASCKTCSHCCLHNKPGIDCVAIRKLG